MPTLQQFREEEIRQMLEEAFESLRRKGKLTPEIEKIKKVARRVQKAETELAETTKKLVLKRDRAKQAFAKLMRSD